MFRFLLTLTFSLLLFGANAQDSLVHKPDVHLENFTLTLIPEPQRDSIESICKSLMTNMKINVVIAIVESVNGVEPAKFATKLANDWNLPGDRGAVLIMLVPSQRLWQIQISNNLQVVLTDMYAMRLGTQHLVPAIRTKEYGRHLISCVLALEKKLSSDSEILNSLMLSKHNDTNKKIIIDMTIYFFICMLILAILILFFLKKKTKKSIQESSERLKLQQRIDSLINTVDGLIRDAERLVKFNPRLSELVDDMRKARYEAFFSYYNDHHEFCAYVEELVKKVTIALTIAEMVSNANNTASGVRRSIVNAQEEVARVKSEYEKMQELCPDLMESLPEFTLDVSFKKFADRLLGVKIDLENAIALQETVKFGPLQGMIISTVRKFDDSIKEHVDGIKAVQNQLNYVNTFGAKYRAKMDESSALVQTSLISPSSRISYENIEPIINSMLQLLEKATTFTYRYALCKEIEMTYNSAVSGFTKELAERNKKQTEENEQQND